jgi:hypothetical protein
MAVPPADRAGGNIFDSDPMTSSAARRAPAADIVFSAIMIVFGVMAFVSVSDLRKSALEPIGPSAFPFAVSIVLVALSGYILVKAFVGGSPPAPTAEFGRRRDLALIALALTIAYFLVMQLDWMTFRWATVLYVGVLTAALANWRVRTLPGAAVLGLVMGFGLKFVFTQVLYLDLP